MTGEAPLRWGLVSLFYSLKVMLLLTIINIECCGFPWVTVFNWYNEILYHINNVLCLIKVNSISIELKVHTSCYYVYTSSVLLFRQSGYSEIHLSDIANTLKEENIRRFILPIYVILKLLRNENHTLSLKVSNSWQTYFQSGH